MLRNSHEQAAGGGQEGEVSMTTPLIATVIVGLNRMFNVTGHGRNQGPYKAQRRGQEWLRTLLARATCRSVYAFQFLTVLRRALYSPLT